mgnify:CR=1 FL=1
MMSPKRTKYRKQFKGTVSGTAHRGSTVSFGEFALKCTARGRMTSREIEAARRAMTRHVKRGGQIYFLHNDVDTIEAQRERLEKLLPEVVFTAYSIFIFLSYIPLGCCCFTSSCLSATASFSFSFL